MQNLRKRGAAVLIATAILAGSLLTASANGGQVTVILNGEILTTQAYVDMNSRTQVPAEISEKLGVSSKLKAGDLAGDTTVVDGYLPLRYAAELAGYEVEWNAAEQSVVLKSPEAKALVLPAKEAALSGQGYDTEGEKADTAYDNDLNEIVLLGEGSQITYTVPAEGLYDVYLNIGKAGTPRGSTVVGFSVNDAPVYAVPTPIDAANGAERNELGLFQLAQGINVKTGDRLVVTGLAGNDSVARDTGKKVSQYPPIGDMVLYPAGTAVPTGYHGGSVAIRPNADTSDVLSGRSIAWLGSSVTYGAAAKGYSMADAIEDNHPGTHCYKYAMSGTTFVNEDASSYVARLKQIDPQQHFDLFIVQLSTNDASGKKPLGTIGSSFDSEDFDDLTVAGAMETIIAYIRETWDCPIFFYTGTRFDSKEYADMVDLLLQLQEKWEFSTIDQWNDPEMTAVTETETLSDYMADLIHPTHTGYEAWWTPKFEKVLSEYLSGK